MGTNRIVEVDKKGKMAYNKEGNPLGVLDIGDTKLNFIEQEIKVPEMGWKKGMFFTLNNNSELGVKIYEFLSNRSRNSYEWSLIEFQFTKSGNIVSRISTTHLTDSEAVGASISRVNELRNLEQYPLNYWNHTHNHPSGFLKFSQEDLDMQNLWILPSFKNAKFFLTK